MKQKVWVIGEQDWNVPSKKSRVPDPSSEQSPTENPTFPELSRKNPAVSFSLSMAAWGSGHRYIGKNRTGTIFMAAMALFYASMIAMVFFREAVGRMVVHLGLPASAFPLGVVAFFLAGLVFWLVNAVVAYYQTVRRRSAPFLGVENPFWPLGASLLFPGWGQFLNGQPIKGLFFLLFGITGVFSIFVFAVAQSLWPMLKADSTGHIFEIYLGAAVLLLPVFILIWVIAAYDAFRSGQKQQRKRLSLKNPGYKPGGPRLLRALIPRGSVILGLLLAISLGMQFFPKNFYRDSLEKVRAEMLKRHVEIVPELMQKVIGFIDR